MEESLQAKHVITANKDLMALADRASLAGKRANIYYEASVVENADQAA